MCKFTHINLLLRVINLIKLQVIDVVLLILNSRQRGMAKIYFFSTHMFVSNGLLAFITCILSFTTQWQTLITKSVMSENKQSWAQSLPQCWEKYTLLMQLFDDVRATNAISYNGYFKCTHFGSIIVIC